MQQSWSHTQSGVLRQNPRVEFRNLAGEGAVLLHLDTAAYHGVNQVGALVWSLLDGVTFADLLMKLKTVIVGAPAGFEGEIEEFIGALVTRDLVLVETG